VALRTRDRNAQNQEELLKWIAELIPGLRTENWRVLDKKFESKGQRLILFIDRDPHIIILRTCYKIFRGTTQGTLTFLDDLEVRRPAEPVTDTVASNLVPDGEGDEIPSPPDDQSKADQGTPLHGSQSEDGEGQKIETDPSSIGRDHENFFKRDSRSRGSLKVIPQQGAGISGAPLRCLVATNEPAIEISTKDRENPYWGTCPLKNQKILLGSQ
jgi:hypothetical protein